MGLFQRESETRSDPVFGVLTGRRGWFGPVRIWHTAAKTKLFPDSELTIELEVSSDSDMELHRKHFQQIFGSSSEVRDAIEESVWDYYNIYRDAEPELPYQDLTKASEIWELLSPSFWSFPKRTSTGRDHDSWMGLNIDWPNPHNLVAYFSGDTLTVVDCEG